MKERPILFSGPMVRAILNGRKTQTRRVARDVAGTGGFVKQLDVCPYGVPGDRLYVKEATWIWCRKVPNGKTVAGRQKFRYLPHGSRSIFYVADHPQKPERESYAEPEMVWRYKTARFMPRWASRITLEITDVRVQRVQDISEEDAKAEGVEKRGEFPNITPWRNYLAPHGCPGAMHFSTARRSFETLWDSINGKKHPWVNNDWVFALTFKMLDDVRG